MRGFQIQNEPGLPFGNCSEDEIKPFICTLLMSAYNSVSRR